MGISLCSCKQRCPLTEQLLRGFHHLDPCTYCSAVECVDRKRKLSSGGGEGEGEGEKQWLRGGVRREQDREVTFSKR